MQNNSSNRSFNGFFNKASNRPFIKNRAVKRLFEALLPVIFWLSVWQILYLSFSNELIMPSPKAVLLKLLELAASRDFFIRIFFSLSKLFLGLIISVVLGLILSFLSYFIKPARLILEPFISLLRSIPIACLTVLLIIASGSSLLSLYTAVFMGLPLVYESNLRAMQGVSCDIIEMAQSFRVSFFKKFRFIYLRTALSSLSGSVKSSQGLMLKAAVAAEMIGLTRGSIGEAIYYSRIYLNTAELFAWTIAIAAVSHLLGLLLEITAKKRNKK